MGDKAFRPAIANGVAHMEQYGRVFLAFPIWWYTAPTILYTFLEQYDMSGKTIIPVATSGGSGMGNTNRELARCFSRRKRPTAHRHGSFILDR